MVSNNKDFTRPPPLKIPKWVERTLPVPEPLLFVADADIAHAKATEQALSESINRLDATLESTKDGILAVDEKNNVLFMNRQFRQMWNMPEDFEAISNEEKLLAYALTQLVDPQGFLEKVQALYHSGQESDDLIELTDGRIFERHSKALKNGAKLSGRVWSFHDITELCRAEQMAKVAKERLRQGQLFANIGTWELNIVSGELYWTEGIAPLFGYPAGDLNTSYDKFIEAVHTEDRQAVMDAVSACIERDEPYDIEHRVVWPDGTVRWLFERGAVMRDADGKPLRMLGVVQDIDERKRIEEALVIARETAERANQAKSEFLSSMSHELRTPMNSILGFAQILEYDQALDPEQQDSVFEILKAGNHLLALINEVLDLAKVESGQLSFSLEPVDLCDLVEETLSLIQPLAQKREILIRHSAGKHIHVCADRTRLKQVLLNLLSNAVKYNRYGGKVNVSIKLHEQDRLHLLVSDTGNGIPSDRLNELFEPFNRLEAEGSEVEGTGIGLTICRRIMDLMGGSIVAESEVGVGSTFRLKLPLECKIDRNEATVQQGIEPCANFINSVECWLEQDVGRYDYD